MSDKRIALLVDIVRSREATDRAEIQQQLEGAFSRAERHSRVVEPLWATAGDEFQAVHDSVADALRVSLTARLLLPDGLDFRIGLGEGEVIEVRRQASGPIQDGSAWWAAREAIDEAHRREDRGSPYVRSWFVSADRGPESSALINSYLLARDQIISRMSARARRLSAGALLGMQQAELADGEGISQSAVSQSLQRSGGSALIAAPLLTGNGGAR